MIVEANVNGIRETSLDNNFALVYDNLDIISVNCDTDLITSTTHNLEVFDNSIDLLNRISELGLNFTDEHKIALGCDIT